MSNIKSKQTDIAEEKISRKEALKKAGRYAAFTAASMITILSPKESQAQSPDSPSILPSWEGD